jgi:hypothetical protein
MRSWLVAFVAVGAAAAVAHAGGDGNGGVFVHGTDLRPRNGVAESIGVGGDVAFTPWSGTKYMDCPSGCINGPYEPLYLGAGVFGTHTTGSDTDTRRDLYGLRASIGLGWGPRDWFIPFGTLGLDALVVNTNTQDGSHHLGPTLGADVRVGVLGMVGERFMYAVSAAYLGAVAPGTGDNAGGVMFEIAGGWRFWPGH